MLYVAYSQTSKCDSGFHLGARLRVAGSPCFKVMLGYALLTVHLLSSLRVGGWGFARSLVWTGPEMNRAMLFYPPIYSIKRILTDWILNLQFLLLLASNSKLWIEAHAQALNKSPKPRTVQLLLLLLWLLLQVLPINTIIITTTITVFTKP